MKSRVINIREDDAALYPTFLEWWKAHGWPGVAVEVLPKCGVLIEFDSGPEVGLAVGWVYMDNSTGVAMLEWVVTNPANSAKQSYMALTMLFQAVREVCLALDYGVLLTTAKQAGLTRIYERNGFAVTDANMTHLMMLTRDPAALLAAVPKEET